MEGEIENQINTAAHSVLEPMGADTDWAASELSALF